MKSRRDVPIEGPPSKLEFGKDSREGRAVYFFFREVATKKLLFCASYKKSLVFPFRFKI
jgi:hypothetical protein